jgi:hypothetical protein
VAGVAAAGLAGAAGVGVAAGAGAGVAGVEAGVSPLSFRKAVSALDSMFGS